MKLEEFPLTVLISDPSVKTKRSDKDPASGRTLFVGGLTSKTTQADVEQILQGHGDVAHIKLGWDPIKSICKGFAFVEMATKVSGGELRSLTLDCGDIMPAVEWQSPQWSHIEDRVERS